MNMFVSINLTVKTERLQFLITIWNIDDSMSWIWKLLLCLQKYFQIFFCIKNCALTLTIVVIVQIILLRWMQCWFFICIFSREKEKKNWLTFHFQQLFHIIQGNKWKRKVKRISSIHSFSIKNVRKWECEMNF